MLEGTCVHLTACEKKRQKTSSSLLLFLWKQCVKNLLKRQNYFNMTSHFFRCCFKKLQIPISVWKIWKALVLFFCGFLYRSFLDITFWNYFWILKWQVSSKTEKILSIEFSLVLYTKCKSNQCTNMWIDSTSNERFPPQKETATSVTYFSFLSFVLLFLLLQVTKVSLD